MDRGLSGPLRDITSELPQLGEAARAAQHAARQAAKINAAERAARIVVRRSEGDYRDATRSYKIEIDGVLAGKVGPGDQVEFSVDPGEHSIRAVIDWTGSPVTPVTVSPGGTERLIVEPAGNAFTALLQIWKQDTYPTLSAE
ncbi:hypothetical protein [Geodermatophilus sp. SYSU D00766]